MTRKCYFHLRVKSAKKKTQRTGLRTALRSERASVVESALETIQQQVKTTESFAANNSGSHTGLCRDIQTPLECRPDVFRRGEIRLD